MLVAVDGELATVRGFVFKRDAGPHPTEEHAYFLGTVHLRIRCRFPCGCPFSESGGADSALFGAWRSIKFKRRCMSLRVSHGALGLNKYQD